MGERWLASSCDALSEAAALRWLRAPRGPAVATSDRRTDGRMDGRRSRVAALFCLRPRRPTLGSLEGVSCPPTEAWALAQG